MVAVGYEPKGLDGLDIDGGSPKNSTSVRLVQPWNTHSPMLVTLSGIFRLVKPPQPTNAYGPMLVMLLGMVRLVNPVH